MARRSDHSREELHEMALAAAREIVEMDGLRELTARRIAARIGYSAGTLYNLFDDLDDLIVQLNGRSLDSLYAALSNLPLDDDPDAGVRALADGYIKFVAAHPRLWNALFEHQRPEGLIIPDWHHEKISRLLGLVERCLAPLFGPLGDKERLHVARVLWSSLHGICSLESAGRLAASESSTSMAMTLVRHFLAGLRKESVNPPL